MTLQVEHLCGPVASQRMALLRRVDAKTHEALQDALPWLADHLVSEAECVSLTDLLAQLATEASDAALALTQRLVNEPEIVADAVGLRKWVLHGLQQHRRDPKRRLVHFQWSDPQVFADRRTESDSAHILAHRSALLHYLNGFNCSLRGIELHEPRDSKLPQPAPSVKEQMLRMPRRFDGVEPKERHSLYRATAAHIAAHLRFSPLAREAGNRRPMLLAIVSVLEDARVERLMMKEFPGLRELWGRFHTATREGAGFQFEGLVARLARGLHDPHYADRNDWVQKGRTAFEEIADRSLVDFAAFDRVARDLSIAMGRMRQTVPPQYRAAPIYRDDNELLWDRRGTTPIDEEITQVIEEFEVKTDVPEPSDYDLADADLRRRVRHPEWDHKLDALREEWATVIEANGTARAADVVRRQSPPMQRLRMRGLEHTPDRSIRLNPLPEGDELDLNAVVDSAVLQRSKLAPDGRVFRRHGRRRRNTAVILLMDLSASTEGLYLGASRRSLRSRDARPR